MIPRLILVIVVAIVFYYALPLSFKKLTMRRRAKDVERLLSLTDSKPVKGTLVSLNENIMTAAPAGSGEEIRVVPNRTRFYLREENGVIEQLNWDSVFLAQKGLSILWLPAKNRLGKNLCLISPPGEGSGKLEEDAKFAEMRDDETAKKWFVAAGAFLEFLFLVEASRFSAYKDVGIAALIAVFGKALPLSAGPDTHDNRTLPEGAMKIGHKKKPASTEDRLCACLTRHCPQLGDSLRSHP